MIRSLVGTSRARRRIRNGGTDFSIAGTVPQVAHAGLAVLELGEDIGTFSDGGSQHAVCGGGSQKGEGDEETHFENFGIIVEG